MCFLYGALQVSWRKFYHNMYKMNTTSYSHKRQKLGGPAASRGAGGGGGGGGTCPHRYFCESNQINNYYIFRIA